MEVKKVITSRNYEMFDKVWFTGSVFYVTTSLYREQNSTADRTKVFDEKGELLGSLLGYWFDFAGKDLFAFATNQSKLTKNIKPI